MADDLKALLAQEAKLKADRQKLDNDKDALEAKIVAARKKEAIPSFNQLMQILTDNVEHFTPAQKNQIKALVSKKEKTAGSGRSSGPAKKIEPKYQLDTGETWTGRGRTSKKFAEWAESAAGKAWRKANDGQPFPPYKKK